MDPKMGSRGSSGPILVHAGAPWGPIWLPWGSLLAMWGPSGARLGPILAIWGPSGAHLGPRWACMGHGPILAHVGLAPAHTVRETISEISILLLISFLTQHVLNYHLAAPDCEKDMFLFVLFLLCLEYFFIAHRLHSIIIACSYVQHPKVQVITTEAQGGSHRRGR